MQHQQIKQQERSFKPCQQQASRNIWPRGTGGVHHRHEYVHPFIYRPLSASAAVYERIFSGWSATLTNLTLVSFFFFYAVGTLLWGPPSDKYGRRPILILGTALYAAASVGCALSIDVYMMIAMRILQGLGAGSITSVSMGADQGLLPRPAPGKYPGRGTVYGRYRADDRAYLRSAGSSSSPPGGRHFGCWPSLARCA